jgi:hypothetical protein
MNALRTPGRLAARLLLAVILTPAAAAPATGNNATFERCQALQDRIDRYSAQRRRGGSGSQMDEWKRQLRKAEAQFRALNCSRYRQRLR